MRHLYTVLFTLGFPLILLRLWIKSFKNPGYRERITERFGKITAPKSHGIWLHAVSLGEINAAIPLIQQLLQKYPHLPLTITTTTPTGSAQLKKVMGDKISHYYFPYDLPWCIQRFLNQLQPQLFIGMETELWPNLYDALSKAHIPILIANGRMSARSARNYRRVISMTKPMLQHITCLAAQTKSDAKRYIYLGLPREKVTVVGNIKFDMELPTDLLLKRDELVQLWEKEKRFVWIAASTHPKEDEQILETFQLVKDHIPHTLLVLVPRHPERFNAVAELCLSKGFQLVKRTEKKICDSKTAIFLGDTMGELMYFYAASDIAFVGGSLVPIGGHNLLEPASVGIPSVTGPYLFNFTQIQRILNQAKLSFTLKTPEEIAYKIIELYHDELARHRIAKKSRELLDQYRGSLERHLHLIQPFIPSIDTH